MYIYIFIGLLATVLSQTKISTSLTYGLVKLKVTVNTTLSLLPFNSEGWASFTLTSTNPAVKINQGNGLLTINPSSISASQPFTISASKSGQSFSETIEIEFVSNNFQLEPVRYLQSGYRDAYYLIQNAIENIPNYLIGLPTTCVSDSTIPGMEYSTSGFTGIPTTVGDHKIQVYCENEVSTTNSVDVIIKVIASSSTIIKSSVLSTFYKYNNFDCNSKSPYNAYHTPGVEVFYKSNKEPTNVLSKDHVSTPGSLTQTENDVKVEYGATLEGYLFFTQTGSYTFQLNVDDGAWFYIDGKLVIAAPGCNDFSDVFTSESLAFSASSYHPFVVHYFQKIGGYGLKIEYKIGGGSLLSLSTIVKNTPFSAFSIEPMASQFPSGRVVTFQPDVDGVSGVTYTPESGIGLSQSGNAYSGSILSTDGKIVPIKVVVSRGADSLEYMIFASTREASQPYGLSIRSYSGDTVLKTNTITALVNTYIDYHIIFRGNIDKTVISGFEDANTYPVPSTSVILNIDSESYSSESYPGVLSIKGFVNQTFTQSINLKVYSTEGTTIDKTITLTVISQCSGLLRLDVEAQNIPSGTDGQLYYVISDLNDKIYISNILDGSGERLVVGECLQPGSYRFKVLNSTLGVRPDIVLSLGSVAMTTLLSVGTGTSELFVAGGVVCSAEGDYPQTEAGLTVVKLCSGANELGSQSRRCYVGENGPKWSNLFSTCHARVNPTDFHYGTSKVTIGMDEVLQLSPIYKGDITEYSISPTIPEGCTFNTTTGIFRIVGRQVIPSTRYEILGKLGGVTQVTSIYIQIVDDVRTYDNIINLRLYNYDLPIFKLNATVDIKFRYTRGTPTVCSTNPALPMGLTITTSGITGYIRVNTLQGNSFTVICENGVSRSNELKIPIRLIDNLEKGVDVYFSKLRSGSLSCNTEYKAFETTGLRLNFVITTPNINYGESNNLVPWTDLNYDYLTSFVATFRFHMTITTSGNHTFGIKSTKGSFLYVDSRLVVNNGGCHGFVLATGDVFLTPMTHLIEIHYFTNDGNRGFEVYYKRPNVGTLDKLSVNDMNHLPHGRFYYSNRLATYTFGVLINPNKPMFEGSGGSRSYSITPPLPAGLSLDGSTGIISGTPRVHTEGRQLRYFITSGQDITEISFEIIDKKSIGDFNMRYTGSKTYLTSNEIFMFLNRPISITISASGEQSNYVVSPSLPSGFTFSESSGTLSGMCSRESTATYTVASINGANIVSTNFTLVCSNKCGIGNYPIGVEVASHFNMVKDYILKFEYGPIVGRKVFYVSKPSASVSSFYAICVPTADEFRVIGSNQDTNQLVLNFYLLNLVFTTHPGSIGGGSVYSSFEYRSTFAFKEPTISIKSTPPPSVFTTDPYLVEFQVDGQYTSVTVTPALPSGIRLYENPLRIQGNPLFKQPNTPYAVTVILTESRTANFNLEVKDCYSTGYYPLTIWYKIGQFSAAGYSWKFFSSDQEYLGNSSITATNVEYRSFTCVYPGVFRLQLSNTNGKRWDVGTNLRITIAETDLGTFFKTQGSDIVSVIDQNINIPEIQFAINPVGEWLCGDQWVKDWNGVDFYSDKFVSKPLRDVTAYPQLNKLYFRYIIPYNGNREILGVTMRFKHMDGVALYINGVEMYRRNIGTQDFEEIREAESRFETEQSIKLFFPISLFNLQNNALAIGFVKYKTFNTFSLSMLANYEVTPMDCIELTGEGSVINQSGAADPLNGVNNAFDLDSKTKWVERTSSSSSSAWVEYSFGENTYSYFDTYGVRSVIGAMKNKGSNPRRISLEASDEYSSTYLGEYEFQVQADNQPLTKTLFGQSRLFNSVKLTIVDRVNQGSDTQVSEVIFQACHRQYCEAEGGFENTMQNTEARAPCPPGYTGYQTRYCPPGWYPQFESADISQCEPGPPAEFKYPSSQYNFYKDENIGNTVRPSFQSYTSSVSFTISPSVMLPGLSMDPRTGQITGTPIESSPPVLYTISCSNPRGTTTIILYISVFAYECPREAYWPPADRNAGVTINCAGGYSGQRTRVCGSEQIPKWTAIVETSCQLTIKSLSPLKGEAYYHFTLSVSDYGSVEIGSLFMDYLRLQMKEVCDVLDDKKILIQVIGNPAPGDIVKLDCILPLLPEQKDTAKSLIERSIQTTVPMNLRNIYGVDTLQISYSYDNFYDYKSEGKVNVLAVVFASIFGAIVLIFIGLCVYFRMRSINKRKQAATLKTKPTGSAGSVRGSGSKSKVIARSVKL